MKLKTTRARAKELIEERIARAGLFVQKVEADGADFTSEFSRFKRELDKWRSFNEDLLKQLYEGVKIAQDYNESFNGGFLLVAQDEYEQYQGYKEELAGEVSFLESCVERLPLYQETQSAGHAVNLGGSFDAFKVVSQLVKSAQKSILVVDGYVDENTLNILAGKSSSVAVFLLTKKQSISAHFKAAGKMFNAQHGQLQVRSFEKIHDRFLIIDDSTVVQSGGSFKDLGKQVTTILPIEDPNIAEAVKKLLVGYWGAGAPENL